MLLTPQIPQQFVQPNAYYTLAAPKAQYAPLFLITKTGADSQ